MRIVSSRMMQFQRALCIGFLSVLTCGGVLAQTIETPEATSPAASDYIRFQDEGAVGESKLQTALTRFSNGDKIVDLVAVVHLGDDEYYQNLNDYLTRYDAVLYELVGGEFSERGEAPESEGEIAGIQGLQKMAQALLGLSMQVDKIDYTAPNFVHADVDWDQLQGLMSDRDQSMATLFSRAMTMADQGEIGGIATDGESLDLLLGQLMSAVMSGDSSGLKRTIAPFLGDAEGFITQLEGEEGTVLVTERNKIVMQALDQAQGDPSFRKFAIFYGAGHMPDLEARLIAAGYSKGAVTWADAWTIGVAPESTIGIDDGGTTASPVSPADLMLNLLQQNPEVLNAVQQMGEALEALQSLAPEE